MSLNERLNHLREVFSEIEGDLEPEVYKALQPCLEGLEGGLEALDVARHNMDVLQRIHKLLERFPNLKLSNMYVQLWEAVPDAEDVPGSELEPIGAIPPPRPVPTIPETAVDVVQAARRRPRANPAAAVGVGRTAITPQMWMDAREAMQNETLRNPFEINNITRA